MTPQEIAQLVAERDGYRNAYETTCRQLSALRASAWVRSPEMMTADGDGIYTAAYDYDGLATDPRVIHNHDFMRDARFVAAFRAGAAARGDTEKMYWRLHVALWCAQLAVRLPGDFVECGVWRGFLSTAIMTYLDWDRLTKRFYLFDTFDGFDPGWLTEAEKDNGAKIDQLNSHFRDSFGFARAHFSKFARTIVVRGTVPETLTSVSVDRVAFLSLDMNCVKPEIAAAEHFWDRLTPGGIILLDDYGFVSYEAQKMGFDCFASQHGVEILALPTGQGMIMKA